MKIDIDTDKIGKWLLSHLNWVVPAALIFLSWTTAGLSHSADARGFLEVWYCFISAFLGLGGAILSVRYIAKVLKLNFPSMKMDGLKPFMSFVLSLK